MRWVLWRSTSHRAKATGSTLPPANFAACAAHEVRRYCSHDCSLRTNLARWLEARRLKIALARPSILLSDSSNAFSAHPSMSIVDFGCAGHGSAVKGSWITGGFKAALADDEQNMAVATVMRVAATR